MSNIPYLEQLTNDEVVTASKAATLALQVKALANQGGGGATLPYKSYVAFLNQTGTSAPTQTIVYNDLGGNIVWTYFAEGVYTGTLSGKFTENKTFCIVASGYDDVLNQYTLGLSRKNSNSVDLYTAVLGSLSNGVLTNKLIEIRVYN